LGDTRNQHADDRDDHTARESEDAAEEAIDKTQAHRTDQFRQ